MPGDPAFSPQYDSYYSSLAPLLDFEGPLSGLALLFLPVRQPLLSTGYLRQLDSLPSIGEVLQAIQMRPSLPAKQPLQGALYCGDIVLWHESQWAPDADRTSIRLRPGIVLGLPKCPIYWDAPEPVPLNLDLMRILHRWAACGRLQRIIRAGAALQSNPQTPLEIRHGAANMCETLAGVRRSANTHIESAAMVGALADFLDVRLSEAAIGSRFDSILGPPRFSESSINVEGESVPAIFRDGAQAVISRSSPGSTQKAAASTQGRQRRRIARREL